MTLDKNTWGFNRRSNLADYLTTHELIETLAETIACGGTSFVLIYFPYFFVLIVTDKKK
jgi:alpha-L-fucosidase